MKKYIIYGTFCLAIMETFLFTQNIQAQNLLDSVSSTISGSSGPASGTVSNSGASVTVSVDGNSLSSNVDSEGATSASASLSDLSGSGDGDGA